MYMRYLSFIKDSILPNNNIFFTFNLINTDLTKKCLVNPNMKIDKFIEYISENVRDEFQINNNYIIEIVKPDENNNNILFNDPDYAPALKPSNMTIYELYGNSVFKSMLFYIRPKSNLRLNLNLIQTYVEKQKNSLSTPEITRIGKIYSI